MERDAFISKLKERLKLPLPGIEVQFEMAHVNREKLRPEDLNAADYKSSAVLLLLIKRNDQFYIPLTERNIYNGVHSAQVSFPGGKFDTDDQTLINTALRECHEEIGLINNIEVIGHLTPVYIPVSKFMVYPFLAVLNGDEITYNVNVKEVKKIIELPINDLRLPELVKQTVVEPMPGLKLKTPYFDIQGKIVWGATAMILNEFKHLLLKL
jgi:8-oxo-dGTP pyrophosphatase MutT (NUDIX family)